MKNSAKKNLATVILTVISLAVNGQTNVSGGIFTNTTWTLANSPYIVIDTVVVFPNVTLTIEAGVIVKFENNKRIEIRQAKLIANGTSTDSITITSNSLSPTPGIYPGIYLNGGNLTSIFNHCNFRYAGNGINVNVSDSVIVNNSHFEYNLTGMQFIGNTGAQVASIDSSNFNNNSKGLILTKLSHASVNHCNFSYNTISGFILGDTMSASNTFFSTMNYCNFSNNDAGLKFDMYYSIINHCNFSNNTNGLQTVVGGISLSGASNLITKNCVFDFNQTGIKYPYHMLIDSCTIIHNQTGYGNGGINRITNCTIDSNSVAGISSFSDSIVNCNVKYNGTGIHIQGGQIYGSTIEYNTFKNIEGYGRMSGNIIRYSNFGIDDSSGVVGVILTYNTIENNNVGIRLNNSTNTITCNSICNNTTYDLQYGAVSNINVSNNNWCTTDSAFLETLIYDGYDNINYGLVFFMPMDTLGCSPATVVPFIAEGQSTFTIFPNPATKQFAISNDQFIIKSIEIYNLIGEKVYSEQLSEQLNTKYKIQNISFPSGIYFVKVSAGEKNVVKKLIVE